METEQQKNIRIKKELFIIDKNIHDMYVNTFECKCTSDFLCREFLNSMSKYEIKKYMSLSHVSFEQKDWILKQLIYEQEYSK